MIVMTTNEESQNERGEPKDRCFNTTVKSDMRTADVCTNIMRDTIVERFSRTKAYGCSGASVKAFFRRDSHRIESVELFWMPAELCAGGGSSTSSRTDEINDGFGE